MKELLRRLEEAEERANEADAAWEQDPENEELEKAFNETYKAEFEAFNELEEAIEKATGIDAQTVSSMIRSRREDLKAIIERA